MQLVRQGQRPDITMVGTTPTTVVIPTWAAMSLLTAMVFVLVGIRMDKVELAAEGSVSDYRRNHRGGGDVARLVDDDRPGRTLETHADAAGEAASPVTAKEPPAAGLSSTAQKYGFYLHVYNQPAAGKSDNRTALTAVSVSESQPGLC